MIIKTWYEKMTKLLGIGPVDLDNIVLPPVGSLLNKAFVYIASQEYEMF
jgi:hypothetical protein